MSSNKGLVFGAGDISSDIVEISAVTKAFPFILEHPEAVTLMLFWEEAVRAHSAGFFQHALAMVGYLREGVPI